MSDFFCVWCAECLAGDYRDHVTGSHQRHVREAQAKLRAYLEKRFTWRWQQEPLPQGSGAGEPLLATHRVDQQAEPAQGVSGQASHTQDDQLS